MLWPSLFSPVLILSFHLCLFSPRCWLTSVFVSWCILYDPKPAVLSCPSHSSWFDHPSDIWWRVQIVELLFIQFFLSCLSFPPLLRFKYSPWHCIHRPLLSLVFFLWNERRSFTPMQKRWWLGYDFAYFNLGFLVEGKRGSYWMTFPEFWCSFYCGAARLVLQKCGICGWRVSRCVADPFCVWWGCYNSWTRTDSHHSSGSSCRWKQVM